MHRGKATTEHVAYIMKETKNKYGLSLEEADFFDYIILQFIN